MLKLLQQVEHLARGTSPAPWQAPASAAAQQAAGPVQPGALPADPGAAQLPRMFSQVPSQLLALKELGAPSAQGPEQSRQLGKAVGRPQPASAGATASGNTGAAAGRLAGEAAGSGQLGALQTLREDAPDSVPDRPSRACAGFGALVVQQSQASEVPCRDACPSC